MRIGICCLYDDKEHLRFGKSRATVIEMQTGPPLTEQPRRGESIQLERITQQAAAQQVANRITKESNMNESSFTASLTTPAVEHITPSSLPLANLNPCISATSNFNYIAKSGEQTKMTFAQVQPGHFTGTYKGSEFTIIDEVLHSTYGAFSPKDKEMILKNYSQAVLARQQGMLGIEARLLDALNRPVPPINIRQLSELTTAAGSKINVNFTAENGEKCKMTFKQIKPGLFRGKCNEREFSIANGQVLPLGGSDKGLNKELILSTFHRAMLGMQQTTLGLQHGEWAIEAKLPGSQLNPMELLKAACPERRILFETESLKAHNEYRKIHGVPPLTHSEYLCEMAREWAEHLALKDTSYRRPNNEYGENLYYSHGLSLDARKAVTAWYDEINLYDFNDPQLSKDTGHFTQLVWRDTKEMGTGIAQLGDKVWVCCYYHPPGNNRFKFSEHLVPRPIETSLK